MKANPHHRNSYEFGDFFVDGEHLMLYKHGDELDLPPKAVETLLALVKKQN
jgi:DNA-binding winged helix-turn-helix (wHTH) protein